MQYRQLGSTGLKVSQLGFGAMRLPMTGEDANATVNRELAIPMIHHAFDHGVNYIDTAVGYCNQDSQRAVGDALKGYRDNVIVSTKNPYYGPDESAWFKNLEDSLERLQIDTIDLYNFHGNNHVRFTEHIEPHAYSWALKAKDQGMIKHIGCSFHDKNEYLLKFIDTGWFEVVTCQYNILDRQLEQAIAHACQKGVGIVVMGPVGGGRLGVTSETLANILPDVKRIPELALRFVLANPNVSLALSGMSTLKQVKENLDIASDNISLSNEDHALIYQHLDRLKEMADLYCTGCAYCMECEHGVNIPRVFHLYNMARTYGLWDHAREAYANLINQDKAADKCIQCVECEEKCPQNIVIHQQLQQAHEALTT